MGGVGVRGRVVSAALCVTVAAGLAAPALADDPDPGSQKDSVDRRIAQSHDTLDGISEDLIAARRALSATQARVRTAQRTLAAKEKALRAADAHERRVTTRLNLARADERKSRRALTANQQAQRRSRTLVGDLARKSYMAGGTGGLASTLDVLTSRGASQAEAGLSMADVLMRQQAGTLNQLQADQATGRSTTARLSAVRAQIATLRRQAQAAVTRATSARDAAARARADLLDLQARQRAQTRTLTERQQDERRDLASLQRQSRQLGEELRRRAAQRARAAAAAERAKQKSRDAARSQQDSRNAEPSQQGRIAGRGVLVAPPGNVVSGFGYRTHPILKTRMLHDGDDFSMACGTPVHAAAAGQVVSAGSNSISGNNVVIDHGTMGGKALATQYMHLSKIVARSGTVKKGQVIGISGSTGRSTGCHLHFSVLVDGRYSDPGPWIG